jgi:chromosome segregation ATPase
MAKDNKKTSNLDFDQDDDPTAELEVLPEAESVESTFDLAGLDSELGEAGDTVSSLKSELKSRAETIRGLQFEIEQLRSRRTGLDKEVKVLEEVVNNITEELRLAHKKQLHTGELLKKRDMEIESLRSRLSGKEQTLKGSARRIEDAKNKERNSVCLEGDIEQSQIIESRGQHRDTTHTSSKEETSGLSEIINALRAGFDAAVKSRRRIDRQVEETDADNALLATESESKQALIGDYEQNIEELHRSKFSAGSQRTKISAGTARANASDKPQELALLVPLNDKASSQYPISTGRLSLGSSPDNDIQIKSGFISRHHAEIVSVSTNSILRDLKSTNGTYVNSKRIKRHALRNGDSISIGKHRFKFVKQNLATSGHESEINGVRIKP